MAKYCPVVPVGVVHCHIGNDHIGGTVHVVNIQTNVDERIKLLVIVIEDTRHIGTPCSCAQQSEARNEWHSTGLIVRSH